MNNSSSKTDRSSSGDVQTLLEDKALVGIDLGATNVRVARIVDGSIEQLEAEKIVQSEDPQELLDQIGNLIDKVKGSEVEGIGVGVPSVVDTQAGIVYDVQNIPSWKEVHIKSVFEERFNKPVFVNNDANCFALGEKYFGKGQQVQSMVGLILGTGFGAGLVLDGRLYSGGHGGAGEVGMMPYRDSIYEHYCCSQFFEREFGLSGMEVFKRAEQGDNEALIMYDAFGTHLGNAIKAVLYALDPELVVLGGSVRNAFSYFKETMWKSLEDFVYPKTLEAVEIEISEREHIAVFGAAALWINSKKV